MDKLATILVVDDENGIRQSFKMVLKDRFNGTQNTKRTAVTTQALFIDDLNRKSNESFEMD